MSKPINQNLSKYMSEAAAVQELGLSSARDLRSKVGKGELQITYSKVSRKAERKYLRSDVIKCLDTFKITA